MLSEKKVWASLPRFPTRAELQSALEAHPSHTSTPEAAKATSLYTQLRGTITHEAPDFKLFASLQDSFFSSAPNVTILLHTMQLMDKLIPAIIATYPDKPHANEKTNKTLKRIADIIIDRVFTWESTDATLNDKFRHRNAALSYTMLVDDRESGRRAKETYCYSKVFDRVNLQYFPAEFFPGVIRAVIQDVRNGPKPVIDMEFWTGKKK